MSSNVGPMDLNAGRSPLYLDFTGASISRDSGEHPAPFNRSRTLGAAPSIVLPHQQYVNHFAVDIGGSLVKLVYFSQDDDQESNGDSFGGRLHFVKFESSRLPLLFDFIEKKEMHLLEDGVEGMKPVVKATGGGAYKHAEEFQERLGLEIEKIDEIESLVTGANFLLSVIEAEAFTFFKGKKEYIRTSNESNDNSNLFPYLLVNIGSGVSLLKVDGYNQCERVSGTSLGGGTFWGLGRLLTGCKTFDELLELSTKGDNSLVDMLVGDIYGGLDYEKIGLEASTIASSFGKILTDNEKTLADYRPADIALALCRMISYNIAQIAYLNAMRYNLKRIFFAGFFIRGHPFTMDTLSYAIDFWSKGEMNALFLRHEGFLGALGAFLTYEEGIPSSINKSLAESIDSRANFVERFTGNPPPKGKTASPGGKAGAGKSGRDWVEKFIEVGKLSDALTGQAQLSESSADTLDGNEEASPNQGISEYDLWGGETCMSASCSGLEVGVLHVDPSLNQFPLLSDAASYEVSVVDISKDEEQRSYWIGVLENQLDVFADKAIASQGGTDEARKNYDGFKWTFSSHLEKLRKEPHAYGKFGLCELLEMREECLRDFGFKDSYLSNKESENAAALKVLPDLLNELDSLEESKRLLALIEGVLAGNIFDWGSIACVELYKNGTILDIYKQARSNLKSRPWRVDSFDVFREEMLDRTTTHKRYRRAILFVDNSGADVLLGMLPLARELLTRGTEVVLAANSLPAVNDITAKELRSLMQDVSKVCHIIRGGLEEGRRLYNQYKQMPDVQEINPSSPPYTPLYIVENGQGGPCLDMRRVSRQLALAAKGADLVVIEGMGRAIHSNYNTKLNCDTLKLAMVKNQVLAETLFDGDIYDCVCLFEKCT
eukprot:CAMPEP_0198238728 /NCGR_PEP_ID=MMETSP1446-20131203/4315_1 /TAXON_ID=1461542 ORGANISM="Unidentified sp, Strain CCMP2111" /NCGR_SAMPLE_ID=MMETSP1446 /ASSEMBLY_ACC=CAM_ASM_001112 /LENGTH=887 /DNA_ID=CAMNT_0043921195 /DNA_START=113 /DNA_END=2776 /DNA_ORIENTATION=+